MIRAATAKKLILDSKRNVWVFYTMSTGKTGYVVKKNRGQPTVGQLDIDGAIQELDIVVDDRDNIHIVALSSEQKVVYLRYDTNDWVTHTLYGFTGKSINISGLRIVKEADNLHLLYVYSEKAGGSALFHHHWTGNEWKGYRVFDIPGKAVDICYDANAGKKNLLRIVAAAGKTLSVWEFDGVKWTQSVRKEGNAWESTQQIILQEDYILIQNSDGVFFFEKVWEIDTAQPEEIIAGIHVEQGPVVINRKNTLYIAWIEGGSLGYRSSYDRGESWGRVKYYHHAQGEKLEVYGFSNTYSLLINAKRIIATNPPELHIPFLHRSTERIRLPEEAFSKTDISAQDYSGKYPQNAAAPESIKESPLNTDRPQGNSEYQYSANIPKGNGHDGCGLEEGNGEVKGRANEVKPCSCQHNEASMDLTQEEAVQTEKIWAELAALEQRIEANVSERLEKLRYEIAELREKVENSDKVNSMPAPPGGNVISQDMINRYLKKR